MGKSKPLHVTEDQRKTLELWVRCPTTEQRLAQRAKVVLLREEGLPWRVIEERAGLAQNNGLKWCRRFREDGIAGLQDRPRSGKPPTITPETKARVIALACSEAPENRQRWTEQMIADEVGISQKSVNIILTKAKIKPHKTEYWCGNSPDPEFQAKSAAITGLYMNPPDNALVLCVDEKSQIQALDRTQPTLDLRAGDNRKLTSTYKRNGTTCLLAALSVHEGTVDGRCVDRNSHTEFLAFLKALYRKHPGREIHVICDNFSAHKHQKVKDWVKSRRRLTLHFTPTYASWLNQIEIWFSILARQRLKDAVWRSKQELVKAILEYIKDYNKTGKPFIWTYSGDPLVA